MPDDQYDDDLGLDDADELEDDDGIVKDGHGVRVPIMLMDADTRAIHDGLAVKYPPRHTCSDTANIESHRPGWRTPPAVTDADVRTGQAYAAYCSYLRNAHQTPVIGDAKPKPKRPTSLADAKAAADTAYAEYCQWLRDAHLEQRKRRKLVSLPYGHAFGDSQP